MVRCVKPVGPQSLKVKERNRRCLKKRIKVLTVIGARPQFIKSVMVSEALRREGIEEVVVHTGQHYDKTMSQDIFDDLEIKKPKYVLRWEKTYRSEQIRHCSHQIKRIIRKEKPDLVLLYGDTNSTVAGVLAAYETKTKSAHVEAGVRSFNPTTVEETNRKIVDFYSEILFAPTACGVQNLVFNGYSGYKSLYLVGDVMYDLFKRTTKRKKEPEKKTKNKYFVLTLHRAENVDNTSLLIEILSAMDKSTIPVVFYCHPRTKKIIERLRLEFKNIKVLDPIPYSELQSVISQSSGVWTDSGGLQKETIWLGKNCFTLRNETEWTETLTNNWNTLVGTNELKIRKTLKMALRRKSKPIDIDFIYGQGTASTKIAKTIRKEIYGESGVEVQRSLCSNHGGIRV